MTDYIEERLAVATDPEEIKRLLQIRAENEAKRTGLIRMISILKEHQISMSVGGCGCCGSPDVTFSYKGEEILDADCCNFSTDEDNKESE